jgi:hypothetical protein
MVARLHRNNQFPVSAWDEDSQRFVGWDEMQQAPYRSNEQLRLFRNLRHPFFWILKASELHEAATALWVSSESSATTPSVRSTKWPANVVFMLGGMSIENLFKARSVCAKAWPVTDASYKAIASGGHRLDKLAIDSGFRTNSKDRLLLQTLSHYVRWSGRYSLPRTIEEFQNAPSQSASSPAALWNQYVALRQKVYGQCMSAMRRWAT